MALSTMLLPLCLLAGAGADVLNDMDQGAAFTKCLTIADFESKTLADDITLSDRDETTGCCAEGSVPGAQFTTSYQSPQIVCGFQADGTVGWSITSGTTDSCDYKNCYVMKQNIECADGSSQFLNGCCEGTTAANTGFPDGTEGCSNYYTSFSNVHGETVQYCTTYATNYGSLDWEGTSETSDDQEDGVLQVDKLYTYAACSGSIIRGGGGDAPAPASSASVTGLASSALIAVATFL